MDCMGSDLSPTHYQDPGEAQAEAWLRQWGQGLFLSLGREQLSEDKAGPLLLSLHCTDKREWVLKTQLAPGQPGRQYSCPAPVDGRPFSTASSPPFSTA